MTLDGGPSAVDYGRSTVDCGLWTHPETIREAKSHIFNPIHLKSLIVWGVVVAITQFVVGVDLKFGQGLLLKFITGKYRRPREEKRIFMFLDISSSTAIAEKLGNERYHQLLKDFFADITNPILDNRVRFTSMQAMKLLFHGRSVMGLKKIIVSNAILIFTKGLKRTSKNISISMALFPALKSVSTREK